MTARFWTARQVADWLGVSVRTLRATLTDRMRGGFPRPLAGPGQARWDARALEAWAARQNPALLDAPEAANDSDDPVADARLRRAGLLP